MKEYVPPLAREALEALSKRWEFTPKGPILIEMFPEARRLRGAHARPARHDRRARRLLRPRRHARFAEGARRRATFNWGETLWHEMAHVITLQLSNNRLPRWLSEGMSVFEERRARAEWGREMDIPFARAIDRGQVLKIRDLNSGLQQLADDLASRITRRRCSSSTSSRPTASRSCARWSQSYADGSDTETAIKKALGVDIDELQKTLRRVPRQALRARCGAR